MDVVQVFNDELQSLVASKPPVSKAKMGLITRAAMKGVKFYKHIVLSVEKFIAKCRPEYKVPGLYVIDSIVRQSRHQFGIERDVYASRFSRNLTNTFNNLLTGCLPDDKPKIVRVLNLWQKNEVFNSQLIQPLLDMANPNSTLALPTESTLSANSPAMEPVKHGQSSKFSSHHFDGARNPSLPNKHHRTSEGGLKFSKNMLDFDYDEDDDEEGDETPTEAEPLLSSTLSKIEMEQRGRKDMNNSISQQSVQPNPHVQTSSLPGLPRGDQDPVLERWNRLIRQQSNVGDAAPHENTTHDLKRSRSRSPPKFEDVRMPRSQAHPPRAKSPNPDTHNRSVEKEAERSRKCLPKIRDKHLTVCSSTLWLGHVPKTVSEADISDAFGEYGAIISIDLIPPRGCAYVCMDRRQDAKRALTESRDLKLNGSHIKMAWAPGKGFKEYKKLKDFWESDIGASYIPYTKIDSSIDFDILEEGGIIDEDSMSMEMREMREKKTKEKEGDTRANNPALNLPLPSLPILAQPPPFSLPPPNLSIPPPSALSQASSMGGIPFPPPNVSVASSQASSNRIYDSTDSQDRNDVDGLKSPTSIEQQLSMTERQINMVEQQLSMIQQAQNMNSLQPGLAVMHPQVLFPHNQPNPMIFDLPPPQLLHTGQQLLDPHQMQIFANASGMIGQQTSMLPVSQSGINPTMNGNSMPHYGGRY